MHASLEQYLDAHLPPDAAPGPRQAAPTPPPAMVGEAGGCSHLVWRRCCCGWWAGQGGRKTRGWVDG
ncbi:hypothetical protein Pmani_029593 [Petrolisthes manimaculis]|uniref:Uncharacterized protein n=1 Tax=Petrolisthes manimaculis TaxID=1843537 RepID=A0AAE1NZP4_9EUCA|nr:hypothetical protein Pmani_029593 [Petrolisthes manimaculis]